MLSFDPLHSDFAEMNGMNPFKSIAVPRPICWVSTVSEDGIDNLAPYSQFSNVGFNPPYVMFCGHPKSDGSRKDAVVNAENTGCFVHNFVPYSLRDDMNITSKPSGREVDEFVEAGLTKLDSDIVKAKRVAESPIQLECEYITTIRLPGADPKCHSDIVIGRVVRMHIDENYVLPNGKLDIIKLRPLSRLGYADYTSVTEVFEMSTGSMKKDPVPGSFGWMSPESLKEKATFENI